MDQPSPQKVVPPLERSCLIIGLYLNLYHRVINMSNINWKRSAQKKSFFSWHYFLPMRALQDSC